MDERAATTTGRAGEARAGDAHARALRHSRRVRFLRRAIPLGLVGAVLGLGLWSFVDPWRRLPAGVGIGAVSLSGTKVVMERPKLTGFKRDNRAYELTAATAAQDVRAPSVIELNDLTSTVEMDRGSFARLKARRGVYDSGAEKLDLNEDVRVVTDNGYDVSMAAARVDFKAGTVITDKPVKVTSAGANVSAEAMQVLDNGQRIVFEGRVVSVFTGMEGPATAPEAEARAPVREPPVEAPRADASPARAPDPPRPARAAGPAPALAQR